MSTTTEGQALDVLAEYIFLKSIRDGMAGDLLYHLFDGDGVTVDLETREIVYIPSRLLDTVASPAVDRVENTHTEQEATT